MGLRLAIDENYFYQSESSKSAIKAYELLLELGNDVLGFSLEAVVEELVMHFKRGAVE